MFNIIVHRSPKEVPQHQNPINSLWLMHFHEIAETTAFLLKKIKTLDAQESKMCTELSPVAI